MAEASISVRGISPNVEMLDRIEAFLQSLEPMTGVVTDIEARIRERNERGLDYKSHVFAPLSKEYAKREGKTRSDMYRTGNMMRQLKSRAISANHGQVKIEGDRAIIAEFHNQGGPRPGRPPQREFMNVTKSFAAELAKKHWDDPLMKIMGRR